MSKEIVRNLRPEEKELNKKKAELSLLEEELTQRELELTSLTAEMHVFESIYLRVVGIRFSRLDDILARIAEYYARSNPQDPKAMDAAAQARQKARESDEAVRGIKDSAAKEIQVNEDFKRLFREVAKKIHPDLSTDEMDKLQRNKLMSLANEAYRNGDVNQLHQILNEYESSPESVRGEDLGAQLVRTLRKLAQVEARLRVIAEGINTLTKSDLYKLKEKVQTAEKEGRDLLSEMVTQLEAQINSANGELAKLEKQKK
jgi:hypothetical protein